MGPPYFHGYDTGDPLGYLRSIAVPFALGFLSCIRL